MEYFYLIREPSTALLFSIDKPPQEVETNVKSSLKNKAGPLELSGATQIRSSGGTDTLPSSRAYTCSKKQHCCKTKQNILFHNSIPQIISIFLNKIKRTS